MIWKRIAFTGLAMALALIALVFAPASGRAHSGHHHAATATLVETSIALSGEIDGAHSADRQAAARVNSTGVNGGDPVNGRGCVGGCCKSAMSCCMALLAAAAENPAPAMRTVRVTFMGAPDRSGLTPDGPRRPPRTFA